MNISLIASLNNHNIYFIKENIISYYISVPKEKNTNIAIELRKKVDRYDFTKNDAIWVKENAINYFKEIDNINKCYVLPIFNDDYLLQIEKNPYNYIQLENTIVYLINSVHALLTNNHINPFKEVYIVKNEEFINFLNYFKQKYGNRISCVTLLELLQSSNVKLGDYKKIESGDMNFVVGSYNEPLTVTVEKPKEVIDKYTPPQEPEPQLASGGYVGYYLLAFISILLTLFILYLVI